MWTWALADALLEKRVIMIPGRQTTQVIYWLARGSGKPVLRAVAVALELEDWGKIERIYEVTQ